MDTFIAEDIDSDPIKIVILVAYRETPEQRSNILKKVEEKTEQICKENPGLIEVIERFKKAVFVTSFDELMILRKGYTTEEAIEEIKNRITNAGERVAAIITPKYPDLSYRNTTIEDIVLISDNVSPIPLNLKEVVEGFSKFYFDIESKEKAARNN
jgi:hypothetical protein